MSVIYFMAFSTFIDEFHAIFAIYINKTSILYGSPAQALWSAICIIPCIASGYSHEKALSSLVGSPFSSTAKSSGPDGNPSGSKGNDPNGSAALLAIFLWGGHGLGNGGLYRNAPGQSIAPSTICNI